jgi:hypothetical protein
MSIVKLHIPTLLDTKIFDGNEIIKNKMIEFAIKHHAEFHEECTYNFHSHGVGHSMEFMNSKEGLHYEVWVNVKENKIVLISHHWIGHQDQVILVEENLTI